ncbi:MAG: DUF4129 domain-containing protein [Bacteroidetes bacterium]|nr:DUF4129 domain-containing protein [Bacteroidota bacterium]
MRIGLARVLDFLLLVGEVAWIYAWAVATGAWSGNGTVVALPELFLLLVSAVVVSRLVASGRWHAIAGRGLVVVLGIATVALVVMAELNPPGAWSLDPVAWNRWLDGPNSGRAILAGGLAAVAWQRGVLLGRSRPDVATMEGSFRIGIIAICGLLALVGLAGSAIRLSSDALIPSTLVLLITGLVGMPLARIADAGSRPRHHQSPALAPSGPWLTMLLVLVAGILTVTLLLAKLFTFERIGTFMDSLMGRLDAFLSAIVFVLAIPFGLLVQALIFLVRLVLKPRPEQPQPQQPDLGWISKLGQQQGSDAISPALLFALKALVALALTAVLAWIIWRAISRLQRFWEQDDVDEVRDSVWSWPGWMAVWRWTLKRLRPAKVKLMGAISRRHVAVEEETNIRSLYRGLLRLGAAIGHPRHIAETPLEYEARLDRVAPEGATEVRAVSDAYGHLRYGPPLPVAPDLDPIASALDRLRGLWESRISGGNRHRA